MSALTRTLLRAYGLAWRAATPLLARHKRLADGFADRLVPEGWPFYPQVEREESGSRSGPDSGDGLPQPPLFTGEPGQAPHAVDNSASLVWIQAASGGEAWLVYSLVQALAALPEVSSQALNLLCTTGTRQGMDVLEKLAAEYHANAAGSPTGKTSLFTILPRFFPLDKPDIMLRAMHASRPRAIVLLETELWPGIMDAAAKERCPMLVLNARMSEKSLSGYKWLSGFWDTHPPASVLAISSEDAARFAALFKKSRVDVMHNIKFDRVAQGLAQSSAPPAATGEGNCAQGPPGIAGNTYIDGSTPTTPLIALASVREEEEKLLLPVIQRLLGNPCPFAAVRIAVVPRHMHRVPAWLAALEKEGLKCLLRSSGTTDRPQAGLNPGQAEAAPILLWDTFGEMHKLYALADAVFVGGSLAPLGGQNFLEPLAQGLIPCVGPHIRNFLWVGEELFTQGLAVRIQEPEELDKALRARLHETLEVVSGDNTACLTAATWDRARHKARTDVQERFSSWVQPRTGGSLQAARELARFL